MGSAKKNDGREKKKYYSVFGQRGEGKKICLAYISSAKTWRHLN